MKMFLKYLLLFLVFMGLQIPLSMTESLIRDRSQYRDEAFDAVAQMQGGEQVLQTPVIAIPYERSYWEESRNQTGELLRLRKKITGQVNLSPSTVQLTVKQTAETREKGVYQVPIFSADITLKGRFKWPGNYHDVMTDDEQILWGEPRFALALTQQTSIKQLSELSWQGNAYQFNPGSELNVMQGHGVHAVLPLLKTSAEIDFELKLSVRGTRALSVIPLAEKADVTFVSNWPHARFFGAQLPDERQLNSTGFSARWLTSSLANNLPNLWQNCAAQNECEPILSAAFGTQLIEPVDIYVSADRAVKYGFLFLTVTFATFVLYEVLYQLKIHPMQYALVGLAITLFFLLLLSFSEQLGFALAYSLAAFACVLLLGCYMNAALRSRQRLAAFVVILMLLYSALYLILQMEDFALIAGAVFLFILLTIAMWLTRHVDWYLFQHTIQTSNAPVAVPLANNAVQDLVNDIKL